MYSNPSLRNKTHPYVLNPSLRHFPSMPLNRGTAGLIDDAHFPSFQENSASSFYNSLLQAANEVTSLALHLQASLFLKHFRSSKTQGTCGCSAHFLGHIPQTQACPGQYIHRSHDKRQPPYTLELLLTTLERSSKHCAVSVGRHRECNKPNCIFVLLLLAYNSTHKGMFALPSRGGGVGVGAGWA